jgi:hypothetical protein
MRQKGFRVFPLQRTKSGAYFAIFFTGLASGYIGTCFGMMNLGDNDQYKYLNKNRSAILSGETPMD